VEPLGFRPRARLSKQIGRDLITDEVVAVFELVKNAYDADAKEVRISLFNVTGPNGEIEIEDDGHGMSYEDLRDKWMEPATADKEVNRVSPGGRAVLGNKGIGRFAVDKLASKLHLRCKRAGATQWVNVWFNWDDFTADKYLDEIQMHPWTEPGKAGEQGLLLSMQPVRARWTEHQIRALLLHLQTLVPPEGSQGGFRIWVECSDFPQMSGWVEPLEPEGATAVVRVDVQADGTVHRTFDGQTKEHKGPVPLCGPVCIDLWYFDPLARSKWATRTRVEWEEWSGVRIYRDGFRVLPYGRPKNDWLGLGERRSKKVGGKLANRDLMGMVQITREANPDLEDTTSRESMKGDRAFEALKGLVMDQIQFLEARLAEAKPASEKEALSSQPAPVPAATPTTTPGATPKSLGSPVTSADTGGVTHADASVNAGGSVWVQAKLVIRKYEADKTPDKDGAEKRPSPDGATVDPGQTYTPADDPISAALQTLAEVATFLDKAGQASLVTRIDQVKSLLNDLSNR
jgi:anti-sigma regulatory factor (Ser/Thr protein kinase)